MTNSSDPPERVRRSTATRASSSYRPIMRGSNGDPPSCSGDGDGDSDSTYSGSQPGAITPRYAHPLELAAHDHERHHHEDDDMASMSTAPAGTTSNNNGNHTSILRNSGAYSGGKVVGGIHSGGGSGSVTCTSNRHHIELRNKRLASTRRLHSSNNNNNHYDHHSSYGDKMMQLGTNAMDIFMPKRKSRFMMAASALVGIVGIIGVAFHPTMRHGLQPIAGTTKTRVLKDISTFENANVATASATGDFLDDFDQRRRRAADLPDGTIFSEPAHTRMCRSIIDRLDASDAGVTNFEQLIFTESEYVCRDPDSPYTSVLNMFAAQLLDSANNHIGLNIDYTHRCAKWERFCTGNLTTVQFHLPDPLSTNAYAFQPGCVDAPMLRSICTDCLAGDDPANPDCVLFPNGYLDAQTNTCNLGCYFSQVMPWIRNNLRSIATNWLSTVETRALTFWLRNAAEFSHREKDDMEVSVVALSCANDGCDMSQSTCVCQFDPLPNWVYAMHIPRSSTNVAIVVSPTCAKFGQGCTLHAQELYHFFGQLYPRADITYSVITSTSSWYMRMITADHLVCPPGVGCLLPAIARDAYTYVYETTSPTVSTWLTCTPQDYLNRLTIPSYPPNFVQGDCRHLRARVGGWTNDMALAPSLQYSTAVDGYLGCADTNFEATAEDPFRAPTTHRWDETIWATCPVDVMTKPQLCTQMDRLGLGRILFVGDHTTMTQAISLASILGQNDAISLDSNVVPNFSKTISCTNTNSTFELSYVRNDRLVEPGTTPSPGFPNCGPTNEQYCYPWSSDFSSYGGKQLLIVNTGYHWGEEWEGYIANFQNFVGRIDEIASANGVRANDVIMFRTSIPGHKECHLHDGVYAHYGEYCPRIVNGAFWHWWGELPPYNDYAIRIINEWNLLNTVKSGPNIELLDPWMMSVLRPDGHLSGSDAGPNCAMDPQECMLYSLPGPVDWWNHLLLMQLKDVGTHLENSSPMQTW
eukprot:CAMPEP_0172297172 /NCGR_PEP_ID=MMETSP1058-20130122/293_1 /TAXON_ID=83371 /ORGANISM="Detonula confervacea, Strain CCMP 353" /LENGTH=978 /DNA_ID=CAMNT_0013006289 /DNA_START=43 /DNA_END=2976 /DNA_ORIENTATION=+